jgi:hypothetical protein
VVSVTLERDALPDSIQIFDAGNREIADFSVVGRAVAVRPPTLSANLFASYYPKLEMRVTSFVLTTDEWNMKSGWQLELEEV